MTILTMEEFEALPILNMEMEEVPLPDPRFPNYKGKSVLIPHMPQFKLRYMEEDEPLMWSYDEAYWAVVDTDSGLMRYQVN